MSQSVGTTVFGSMIAEGARRVRNFLTVLTMERIVSLGDFVLSGGEPADPRKGYRARVHDLPRPKGCTRQDLPRQDLPR